MDIEDENDDWNIRGIDAVDEQGLRVLSGPCSTCIFRAGNLMDLHPGRVKGMVEDVVREDTFTPCHKTLTGRPVALCHGMTKRHRGAIVRAFDALGAIHEVDPEEVEHAER